MTAKASPAHSSAHDADSAGGFREVTGLLASRPLAPAEIERVLRVLAAEGLELLQAARITIRTVRKRSSKAAMSAMIIPEERYRPVTALPDRTALDAALAAARARGTALKDEMAAESDMLSTAEVAERLGMSEEGVRLKRKRHEILGLEFAKRGIRYPAWQILPDRQLLPALPALFGVLGDDPWRIFRFLQQRHGELGGDRAVDALRQGRIEAVLAAAENTTTGAFA